MNDSSLLYICISAFLMVFVILVLLSVIMRLIIYLFPQMEKEDSAVLAAIAATINTILPNSKITKIKEQK